MSSSRQRRLLKLLRSAAIVFLLLVGFCIIAFYAAVKRLPYPAAELLPPISSTIITDRNGNTIGEFAGSDGNWYQPISAKQISPHLLDAIVAVEDQRFYQHGGVDWKSAASALWEDVLAWRYRRGASTLTMQLEHLRKPEARSLTVKLVQAIRACQIENRQSKQQILVEYLNRAPFGGNLVGAGAASWRYFGKNCADLSLGQAALLAGIPQSPVRLRPDRYPDVAMARRDHVLERMLACGMINDQQRREASAEPIDAGWLPLPQEAPDQAALLPTLTRLARESPGSSIRTTLDPAIQREADTAAEDQLKQLISSHVSAAAVVVLDTTSGRCLAAVSRAMDRPGDATDVDLTVRPRSSGSTLKPLIYAAAFDAGICTPQTVLDDSPAAWAGYQPSNYDREFSGPMPAAEMLSQSRNVPAMKLLSDLKIERAVGVMQSAGLTTLGRTPERYGLSLAIGGADVTPMELAEAYATLARGGVHRGVVLAVDAGRPMGAARILRQSSCLQVLECIADVGRTGQVCPQAVELAPAWKTGTSSGHRDAWCAAVTRRHTVVVWLGNADGSGSDVLIGQDTAAPLALRILVAIEPNHGAELVGFAPPPDFLTSAQPAAAQLDSSDLSMLCPVNHQRIITDPGLSADQQRVPLRARMSNSSTRDLFWWMVDGQCVGNCHNDQQLWWSPTAGLHEIRVVNAAGQAVTAEVEVVGMK